MRKYCSKVQTCTKCGRRHAAHLCEEISAKFAKKEGGKPTVNAVLGSKTSTNLVMSKLHSRCDYSDSSEDEARDNSCFVIRTLPCNNHKCTPTEPVDSDSDSDVPDLVGSSDDDEGQAPAQRVSQGPIPRRTYAEVLPRRTTPAEGHRQEGDNHESDTEPDSQDTQSVAFTYPAEASSEGDEPNFDDLEEVEVDMNHVENQLATGVLADMPEIHDHIRDTLRNSSAWIRRVPPLIPPEKDIARSMLSQVCCCTNNTRSTHCI